MWKLYRLVLVKRDVSMTVKLLIYRFIYVPDCTYSHEILVMTE